MMAKLRNQEHSRDHKGRFNRFVETARALGCDEDKEQFEKSLGKIAAYKPSKGPTKNSTKKAK
jgi:hypothetical protein